MYANLYEYDILLHYNYECYFLVKNHFQHLISSFFNTFKIYLSTSFGLSLNKKHY